MLRATMVSVLTVTGTKPKMQKQRERARACWKGVEKKTASPVFSKLAEEGKTVFDGYAQTTSTDCRIVALVREVAKPTDAK